MKPQRYPNILIFLAALLAPALPPSAWAQFTFTTNNDVITITGYNGGAGYVAIPSTINGYPVTSVGTNAFYNRFALNGVTIPNSVTNIGDEAFYGCSGLTNVTIGNSVISIGNDAFQYCYGLTTVTIPGSVSNIGNRAFAGCSSLANFTVNVTNPSLASVGGVLFNEALTTLVEFPGGMARKYAIPDSVTTFLCWQQTL